MFESVTKFKGTVVLVQGSSASGKSRLVSGVNRIVRETGLDLEVEFAKRYTTREPAQVQSARRRKSRSIGRDPCEASGDKEAASVPRRTRIPTARSAR